MALDPSAKQIVVDWINKHCPNLQCAACGAKQWKLGDLVAPIAIVNFTAGQELTINSSGEVMLAPLIPMGCDVCGYSMLFSAKKMGL